MSYNYEYYSLNNLPSEIPAAIVNDICSGKIGRGELQALILELDKNHIFNNAAIDVHPKNEWNKDYLETLANKIIFGTFSKQYIVHLADVSEYVNASSKSKKWYKSPAFWIGVGIIGTVVVTVGCVISFSDSTHGNSKTSTQTQNLAKQEQSSMMFVLSINESENTNRDTSNTYKKGMDNNG